jgi:hypothetical protein
MMHGSHLGISSILTQWTIRDLMAPGGVAMKPYIIGAIIVWFICGIVGAVMLGEQRVDIRTIAGGPFTLWKGLNQPVDG